MRKSKHVTPFRDIPKLFTPDVSQGELAPYSSEESKYHTQKRLTDSPGKSSNAVSAIAIQQKYLMKTASVDTVGMINSPPTPHRQQPYNAVPSVSTLANFTKNSSPMSG